MSEAAAEKFVERLEKDKPLLDEVKKTGNIFTVAKKHGAEFSASDLKAAVKKRYGGKTSPHFHDHPDLTCFA